MPRSWKDSAAQTDVTGVRAARNRFSIKAALLQVWLALLSCLPLRLLHTFGTGIGWLFVLIPNRRRRIARINLALCFPELDPRARKRLWRQTLIEFGKGLVEPAALWTKDAEQLQGLVKEIVGEQELQDAFEEGKGVILAAPHLGAWEIVGLYCQTRGPLTALYRPPRVAELDQLMRTVRQRLGAKLVPATVAGIRALYTALRRGEMVGILPDQVPNEEHNVVYADFFGIRAKTMVLLSKLAHKTSAPVVFSWAERLAHGVGYRLHFARAPAGIASADLQHSATLINAEIERHVRRLPAQYQWCYKRFRDRPPGERSFYNKPKKPS